MSKKSRTLKAARDQRRRQAVTTLDRPADVVTMIPYVLGFLPSDSLVVVALQGPRRRFGPCLRVDLPEGNGDAEEVARYLVGVIALHGFDTVIVVAFCADGPRADAAVEPLLRQLSGQGVRLTEALRADGRRWWSYLCADPDCCGPAGHSYDPESSRVAAEAVAAGLQRVPDRDSLRAQFEPGDARSRQSVAAHCELLSEHQRSWAAPPFGRGDLDRLIVRNLGDPEATPPTDVAQLALCIQQLELSGHAWALMTRANADIHFLLWRRVLQLAPAELVAPAAGLTGFAAWLDGRGVEAMHAVDRLEAVCPGDPMGRFLRDILDATVSPDSWRGPPPGHGPAR